METEQTRTRGLLPGMQWYLIRCRPRQDERAFENLQRQKFHCYRPVRYVERRRGGRTHAAEESLFPGYLFIRLDCRNDNWSVIRSTRGVREMVRFNEHPASVRDDLIDGIRARLAGGPAREPYLKPGERVTITAGAFAEMEAIFLASDGDQRVVLLLSILQTEQTLTFPVASVRKLG
jgi:transcriptional antiterminator RfaH